MAEPRSKIVSTTLSMPVQATEYAYTIPDGAKNGVIMATIVSGAVNTGIAFRVSATIGVVAGGGGLPVAAGQSWQWISEMLGTTKIYVAHNNAAAATLQIQYEINAAYA